MTSSEKPKARVVLPIVIIIAVAVIAMGALSLVKSQLSSRASSGSQASDGSGAPEGGQGASGPAVVGARIPDFSLTSLDGKSAKFSDVVRDAGAKVILVNFWATWCEACVDEIPSLVKVRTAYKSKGFEIVGINLDENPAGVVPRAEKELGISFPVFSDKDGKIADYFDVHAIPLSVVVDSGRKILYIENGERNWNDQEIHQKLDQWLSDAKT